MPVYSPVAGMPNEWIKLVTCVVNATCRHAIIIPVFSYTYSCMYDVTIDSCTLYVVPVDMNIALGTCKTGVPNFQTLYL